MDKPGKASGKFVEAGKHPTKLLEFVEKAFDEMAFAVEPGVIVALNFGTLVWRDNRRCMVLEDKVNKGLCRISSIGDDVQGFEAGDERFCLSNIMTLPCCEAQAQGVTRCIYTGMDFTGEPASVASEGLCVGTTVFSQPRRTRVGTHNRRIHQHTFQIPLSHQRAKRRYTLFHFPYSFSRKRHCAPLHSTHTTPSMNRRQPRTLPISTSLRPRRYAWIFAHSLSFSRTLFVRYKFISFVHTT